MEELYNLVVQKTGLPKDQAKMAVDVVVDFIKKKLPAPIAGEVDAVLGGTGNMGAAADMLGGLFGGKK